MAAAAEPWTTITRRDKDQRRAHRKKMGLASMANPGVPSPDPLAAVLASSSHDSSPTTAVESQSMPKTNDIIHGAYKSSKVRSFPKASYTASHFSRDKHKAYDADPSSNSVTTYFGSSRTELSDLKNAVTTYFELGRTTLSHVMAKKEDIYEQLLSAGLRGDFKVKVESSQCGFSIMTQNDLTQQEKSVISSFTQRAKQEVLEKPHKLNYAGRGSGHFVMFQNGSEARHITSYDDERGVLVFAEDGLSNNTLKRLKFHGDILIIEQVQAETPAAHKATQGGNFVARGSKLNDNKPRRRNLCGKIFYKTFDSAKKAAWRNSFPEFNFSKNHIIVKPMHDSENTCINEGGSVRFTSTFPHPVRQVRLTSVYIHHADIHNLRRASKSPGVKVAGCLCPWNWDIRDNDAEVHVDVRKLVEKHGWLEDEIRWSVQGSVSHMTGVLFSSDMVALRAGVPQKNNHFITSTWRFIESVAFEFIYTGACNIYLSPLTTDQVMVMEAVFKNPDDAKFVAFERIPDSYKNGIFIESKQVNYKAFPYFSRKQLSPRMYQVTREGLDVLRDTTRQEFGSAVIVETAMTKNGGTVVFLRATRRDFGNKAGLLLNNLLKPEEVKITSDVLSSFNLFSTFSCKRWIKSLENRNNVHLYLDEFRQTIQIYGSPEIRARVKRDVEEWLERKDRRTIVINIDSHANYWPNVVEKYKLGLESLATDCGAEHVLLNFKAKKLLVVGTKSSASKLRQILSDPPSLDIHSTVAADECVACFCEASGSCLRLGLCGHVYCLSCFYMHLFVSAEGGQFPLRCASCNDPVLMEDVRSVLREDQADLQWFINRNVSSMVAKHSNEYNHCSSPDCNLVYACQPPGGTNNKFECPACGMVTCRSCRVPYHEGEACWLYRMNNNKDEYELALLEWMREDIENRGLCPRCGHGIEKDGGCNNIHCSRCGANICWLCMKDFSNQTEAYHHLDEVHGGVYHVLEE